MWCFVHFVLKIWFTPPRSAFSWNLNFQKSSAPVSKMTLCKFKMCFAPQRRAFFAKFLTVLTPRCASRNNCVHFFDISTANEAPMLTCFEHCDLKACFAPQWRAIFHLSSGQLAASSAPAASASLLFDTPETQNNRKNTVFHECPTFSRTCIFCLLTFSDFLFFDLLFSLTFSSDFLLFFSSVHIVGSSISKLPSKMFP